MAFADTVQSASDGNGVGTFLRLSTEYTTDIYILDDAAYIRWTHWLPEAMRADRQRRGLGISCPGPQICPVCLRNAEIKIQAGEAYRKHKDFRPSRKRFLTNVLNVTPVKICQCGAAYTRQANNWPSECSKTDCQSSLEEIEPSRLNRIQILEGGITLFQHFNAFENEITDTDGNILSLREFPIKLTTSGEGRNKTTAPVPIMSALGPPKEEYFLLPSGEKQERISIAELVKPFTPEEILHLVNGGSIADIYEDKQAKQKEDKEELPW